jgi:cold shock CspA family protein/ribosome-associated translation inhibitor RaiA
METPPQITFQDFTPSDAARAKVEAETARLDEFFDRITDCRVVVRRGGHRRHRGDLFEVSIHLSLPEGRSVDVSRNPGADHAHEDLLVAVRDAFAAARRQLQEEARKMRGDVKHHEAPPLATVKTLIAEQGYGFVESADGREIYFHRNAVIDGAFDDLEVGQRVAIHEDVGEKGPQASTVRVIGKHELL